MSYDLVSKLCSFLHCLWLGIDEYISERKNVILTKRFIVCYGEIIVIRAVAILSPVKQTESVEPIVTSLSNINVKYRI